MLVNEISNPNIYPIKETLTIKEALEFLLIKNINGAIVVNDKGELTGIFSMQDVARAIVPQEMRNNDNLASALYAPGYFHEVCQETKDKQVKNIMRKEIYIANPQTNIMEIAAEFLNHDLYIVPVVENEKPVGIVTRSDIRKAPAREMDIQVK